MKGGSQVVFLASETLIMSAEVFFFTEIFLNPQPYWFWADSCHYIALIIKTV